VVQPPQPGEQPAVAEAIAATKIWASSVFTGHRQEYLGFGIVTVRLAISGVPPGTSLPAWVGLATANASSCPAITEPTGPTTTESPLPSAGYSAVVIGAATGSPAVSYVARTAFCDYPPSGPTVAVASEVVSVPWLATGPDRSGEGQLTGLAQIPSCGTLAGPGGGGKIGEADVWTVTAIVPDDGPCVGTRSVPVTIGVDLPNAPGVPTTVATPIEHGPLGPVQQAN